MTMLWVLVLLSFLGLASAQATWRTTLKKDSGAGEFWSCYVTSTSFVWDYTPLSLGERSASQESICGYQPTTGTVLLCCADLADYDKAAMKRIFSYVADYCDKYSSYNYGADYYKEQYENATIEYRPITEITNMSSPVYFPTLPNMTAAEAHHKTYMAYYTNLDDSTWFCFGFLVYFLVLIVLAALVNFMKITGTAKKLCNPVLNKFRSYCTLPALLPNGSYAELAGRGSFTSLLPNRVESLVCLGITLIEIGLYCVPYHAEDGAYFGAEHRVFLQFLADRAGILAFGKLPIIVLLAGRNSILIWLTGIKYSSWSQYHKMVSRWMFVDAMIHSIGYTLYAGGFGGELFKRNMTQLYWISGIGASILCGVIVFFSMNPFRVYDYELFLYSHIALALAFLVMCWYHCRILGWCEWLIASLIFWAGDRLLRLERCAIFGIRTCQIELINEDSYKVTVQRPKLFNPLPGQFGYVYFADRLLWFQNHPFTLVNTGDYIEIYITAKKGITEKILKQVQQSGGYMEKLIVIEGPYGERSPVEKYDNALFIGGGAGIPGIADGAAKLAALDTKEKVKLVYVERTLEDAHIYLMDLVSKLKDTKAVVELYLSREEVGATDNYQLNSQPMEGSASDRGTDGSKRDILLTNIDFINVHYGRPDIKHLIADETANADGSLAIITCGAGKMVDQVRAATADAVLNSTTRIDLYDELQRW